MDQSMLTAKELHAQEQMDPWTDQHHQDVSYQNQLQFQNITMIQKLEDLIKQLVILLILIKFHYQHHIQDKTLTTSPKPKEHQSRENQKKFQSSIPQLLKPTPPSTDKMMNKV
jgi:endo-beta-N-acetylglucosaminidase D